MTAMGKVIKVMRRGPVMPAPYKQAAKHKPTLFGKLAMERWVGLSGSVPDDLKTLAQLRASALVGCLW